MSVACKRCGAPMVWAKNPETGKALPIDAAPDANGNIALEVGYENGKADLFANVLTGDELEREPGGKRPLHKSHFATCPAASEFRRR